MASVLDLVDEIRELASNSEKDAQKCDKGNRSAGIRLRKTLLAIVDLAKEGRKRVVELRG